MGLSIVGASRPFGVLEASSGCQLFFGKKHDLHMLILVAEGWAGGSE